MSNYKERNWFRYSPSKDQITDFISKMAPRELRKWDQVIEDSRKISPFEERDVIAEQFLLPFNPLEQAVINHMEEIYQENLVKFMATSRKIAIEHDATSKKWQQDTPSMKWQRKYLIKQYQKLRKCENIKYRIEENDENRGKLQNMKKIYKEYVKLQKRKHNKKITQYKWI